MRKKTKIIVLVEIVIVLCSVFLVAITAIAAEQTTEEISAITMTASKDDFVLGIYGNANEDDTIDMRDLTYVKLIFFGKKPETELADAKYDGKINPLDFIQIKLIIVGKENELTVVDSEDRIVTVKKPIDRVVAVSSTSAEVIRTCGAKDKVVGVCKAIVKKTLFFPGLSKLPSVGGFTNPDCEKIIELKTDIVFQYSGRAQKLGKKLEPAGIAVVGLDLSKPKTMTSEVKKLGYIMDRKDEAEEFIDWYEGHLNTIKDRTEGLSEDKNPRVCLEAFFKGYKIYGGDSGGHQMCTMAGGINIAGYLPEYSEVDPEWVIVQNPDTIVKVTSSSISSYNIDDPAEVKALRESIMNRPGFEKIKAVENNNVYLITTGIWCKPSYFVGIIYLAKWFHPELFEDLDPQAIHQEYLTRFQGLDIDVSEHGIFVYHPELYPDGR